MDHKFWEQVNLAKLATLNKKHFAFIGSMLYKLKIEPTESVTDTYLDGINNTIKINPTWFKSLTPEHAASMLAHEVLHYSLQHDIRMGSKNYSCYQNACDHVVNNMLMDFNFQLPDNISVDRKYQNQSTEQVYKQVFEEFQQKGNEPNNNQLGGNDIPNNQPNINNFQQNQRNQAINQSDLANQASGSKSIGSSGEAFKTLFEEINEGKINWKQLLQEYFNELTVGEPSYHELDRRMLSFGYFEPVTESLNTCHRVALALDVSGSVSEEQIKIFLQEIKAITLSLNPEIVSVMTFNHNVVDVFELKPNEPFDKANIDIGGGTALEPVIEHYNKPENKPEFLIVFSDLEVWGYPDKPKYPVTWLCFDNKQAEVPYGKLIHVNSRDLK